MQVRKKSQKQEKSTASKFGGRVVIASGALWASKADVRTKKYLVECKTTEKDYYSVTSRVWEKIEKEAVNDGLRIPILQVDIKDGDSKESYVVITKLYLTALIGNFDYEEYNSYATEDKSFRLRSMENDDYAVFYSIKKIVPTAQTETSTGVFHHLAVMRLDDFLENIKEDIHSGT